MPMMVAKTISAIMAVIGFAVPMRGTGAGGAIWPFILLGVVGLAIFFACERLLKKKARKETEPSNPKEGILAWLLLLALAGIFILVTLLAT